MRRPVAVIGLLASLLALLGVWVALGPGVGGPAEEAGPADAAPVQAAEVRGGDEAEGPPPLAPALEAGEEGEGEADDEPAHPSPISCRVMDPAGWPVDAEVRCGEDGPACRDEAVGEYTCRCGAGSVTLHARAEGIGEGSVTAAPGDRVVIRLNGYGFLRFRLVADAALPASVVVDDRGDSALGKEAQGPRTRPARVTARIGKAGRVEVPLLPGVHDVAVRVDGFDPALLEPFALGAGEVHDAGDTYLSRPGILLGLVLDTDGRPAARSWVEVWDGAGGRIGRAWCGEDGFFSLEVPSGDVEAQAFRADGLLTARSPRLHAVVGSGGEAELRLVLPSRRTGGLGIQIASAGDGVAVQGVIPGGPGERLGLEPGDVIVAVDGAPVDGRDLDAAVGAITGASGSSVRLTVRRGDQVTEHTARREEILDNG
ncbi:PDZ domain-containing protein [Myxococcota bacterium]|nr:PDZ domain-containing protein [Myxococcota bacterium]